VILQTLFFLFGAIVLGAAINVLVQRHVLYSALSLIVMLGAVSGLFVLLRAEMLALIQIVVYTGAIMVLFIFVIMLLNVSTSGEETPDPLLWLKFVGIPGGLFLLALISSAVWPIEIPGAGDAAAATRAGSVEAIGLSMFTDYLLAFEATSVLILIAIGGALVQAKRDR